jgi:hypothetical protein
VTFAAVGSGTSIVTAGGTFTLNPSHVGDLFIASISAASTTVFATGITSSNITWTQAGTAFEGAAAGGTYCTVWLGKVTATGNQTQTISFSGATPSVHGFAQEFSSTAGSWAVDGSQGNLNANTATCPSLTPSQAGDIYWCAPFEAGSGSAGSTTGYTYFHDAASDEGCYNPACTTSAQAPVFGNSDTRTGIAILIKETGGAGAAPYPLIPPAPFTPMGFRQYAITPPLPTVIIPAADTGTGAESSAAGAVLAASASAKALQRSASDKIAYLYDGTALIAYWDGSSGQVRQVAGVLGTPQVSSVISTAEDAISLWVSNTSSGSDIWVCSSDDDASGAGPSLHVRHGTYSAGSFTWNTAALISGTTTADTIQSVITWNGTYLMVFWWDGASGSDRISYAYTTDKTGTSGWSATATFAGGSWSSIVQLSVRHSARLGATVLVYGAHSTMNYAVLADSATPALGNWGGNTVYDQFDDSLSLFGGPQVVIDESTGAIHVARAVSNNTGPSWDGVIYWNGAYSSSGSGSVTFAARVTVSPAASSTGPADIAVAVDKNSTAWVLWVDSTSQGNLAYATLTSPFTSASSATILVAGSSTSNPRWPHVPAVSASQGGLADALPVLYMDTTSSLYPVILNTSIILPGSIQPPADLLIPPGFSSPMAWQRQSWPSQAAPGVPSQDAGTGAEAGTIQVSGSDAGTGTEGTTVQVVSADTGTGTDSASITVTDTDTGTGAESSLEGPAVQAYPLIPPAPFTPMGFQWRAWPAQAPLEAPSQDSGTGTDSSGGPQVGDSDAGTGAETATITISGPDTGTGADSGTVLSPPAAGMALMPPAPFTPMGWQRQSWPSAAPLLVSGQDSGTGGDSAAITVTDADTGTGADAAGITISAADAGTGADSGTAVAPAGPPVPPLIPPGFSSPMAWQRQSWPSQAAILVPSGDAGSGADTATAAPVAVLPPGGRLSGTAASATIYGGSVT